MVKANQRIERNGMTLAHPPVVNLSKPKLNPVAKVDPCIQVLKELLAFGEANEITLTENLPYDRLHILLAYPEHFQYGKPTNKCWQLDYIIPKYLYRKNRSPDGAVRVCYREKAHGIGRHLTYDLNDMYLSASFGFTRHARNFMYHDVGVDIDMENCSGRLFEYLLTVCHLPHPNISKYVSERRSILQELQRQYNITRDQAKLLSICISYGGKVKSWMEKVGTDKHPGEMWDGIVNEIDSLIPKFKKLDIWDKCPVSERKLEDAAEPEIDPNETEMQVHTRDLDAEEALIRSRVAYIMQHLEKRVLMVAYRVCLENGVKPLALCFDGLIVDRASLPAVGLEGLLAMIKERVGSEFPGLHMPFENKPMECPEMPRGFNSRMFDSHKYRFNSAFMKGLVPRESDDEVRTIKDEIQKQQKIYDEFGRGLAKQDAKAEINRLKERLEEIKRDAEEKAYERQMAYFESFVGIIQKPKLLYYVKEYDKSEEWGFYAQTDVVKLFSSETGFVKRWLADAERHTYTRVDFLPRPLTCPPNVLNTFHGLAIEDTPSPTQGSADFNQILEHISFLCNGEKVASDYLLKYFAHMVQFPGSLPRVAIVLHSLTQGVGKNILIENICKTLMGIDYLFMTAEIARVTGRFTGIANKFVVILDEIEYKNHKQVDGIMKNFVVSDTVVWEAKNQQQVTISNFARVFILSNKQKPIKIEQSDRRHFIVECLATAEDIKEMKEAGYFDSLGKTLTCKETMRAFYDYLMNIDLSDFDVTAIPETESRKEMLEAFKHNVFEFLERFTDEHLSNPDGLVAVVKKSEDGVPTSCIVRSSFLLDEYNKYLVSNKLDTVNNKGLEAILKTELTKRSKLDVDYGPYSFRCSDGKTEQARSVAIQLPDRNQVILPQLV